MMKEIFDNFTWTKENKTITADQHQVPGLGNFTHWGFNYSPPSKPMHFHSNMIELHCLVKGKRRTQVEKNGEILTYHYRGNQVFLTFPFEIHGSTSHPEDPCEFFALQLNLADADNLLGLNPHYSRMLFEALTHLSHRLFQVSPQDLSSLRTAFALFSELDERSILMGLQYLNAFLLQLPGMTPIMESTPEITDPSIKQALKYINSHLNESLSLADVAGAAGYSVSRFKTKFKSEVGITPAEYIQLEKVNIAKRELMMSDVSITDLSFRLGYSSSNYFSTVFKRFTDSTPNEYRRTHRKGGVPEFPQP